MTDLTTLAANRNFADFRERLRATLDAKVLNNLGLAEDEDEAEEIEPEEEVEEADPEVEPEEGDEDE